MKENSKMKKTKPKYNMWQNSWYMIKLAHSSKEKKVIVLCLLSALLAVAQGLCGLYISPTILSVVERQASVGELVLTILVFVAAMMFISAASAYVDTNKLYGRVTVRCEIIARAHSKISTTSYPNLFNDKFTELNIATQKSINTNSAATEAVWDTLTMLAKNLLGFVIYLLLLSYVQPMLFLLIILTTVISYFVGHRASEWRYKHRSEESEYEGRMYYANITARGLSAAKDIRIFGLRPWLEEVYKSAENAYGAWQNRAESAVLYASVVDLLLTFARNAVAYAYLIGLVLKGGLGVSEFLLYFSAVEGFAAWVNGILSSTSKLHKQSLELCSVREFLEFEEPFKFEEGEHLEPDVDKQYEIRLENVSFRYPNADKDTLTNIDLTLHPGEKLAVVGLNGAGKTTLIKLICGFLDPTEGRVLLDGKDIRDYNRRDYYKMFSAVFQEFSLLAGTITTNVTQDVVDVDMERVKECVERAGLAKKIEELKDGYETKLNREVYDDAILLSGGETQRLMLARALYKDAPFIILDEPTAALDPIAESEMYQKYNEMTKGRSSVYISHRLASTRFCDRIIMISDGVIGQEGTHDELLAAGGEYAKLYEVQSKYYRKGEDENEEKQ